MHTQSRRSVFRSGQRALYLADSAIVEGELRSAAHIAARGSSIIGRLQPGSTGASDLRSNAAHRPSVDGKKIQLADRHTIVA